MLISLRGGVKIENGENLGQCPTEFEEMKNFLMRIFCTLVVGGIIAKVISDHILWQLSWIALFTIFTVARWWWPETLIWMVLYITKT